MYEHQIGCNNCPVHQEVFFALFWVWLFFQVLCLLFMIPLFSDFIFLFFLLFVVLFCRDSTSTKYFVTN